MKDLTFDHSGHCTPTFFASLQPDTDTIIARCAKRQWDQQYLTSLLLLDGEVPSQLDNHPALIPMADRHVTF